MAKAGRPNPDGDAYQEGAASLKRFVEAVDALRKRGDIPSVEKLLKEASRKFELDGDPFGPFLQRAKRDVDAQRAGTGSALRDAARAAGCHFDFRPPHAEFGCVRLHEKKPGQWTLSVLDDVPIETVATTDGSVLASAAIRQIESIEQALSRSAQVSKDLLTAVDAFRRGSPAAAIPANLLMVIASHGSGLRKSLTSGGSVDGPGLTRAQFGYLLARLNRQGKKAGELQFSFTGAAQGDAAKPEQFIPVPDSDDPRKQTNRRLVSTVTASM